jgi:UDP-N-acetylmuramate dehydrogenase
MADLMAKLQEAFGPRVEEHARSDELTTYRCGGPLALVVRIERADELGAVAAALSDTGDVDVLVIGRGSNLLVADKGFDGLAITLTGQLEACTIDPESAHVDAGAGLALPVLARRAAAAGVAGLEFFVGIPGSVGGAVRMNAGGHGSDTDAVIMNAQVANLDAAGEVRVVNRDALGLGYRSSALGSREVVVGARFEGRTDAADACGERIDEIVRWRREHQPGGQNAGSVFTNPPGDAAGRLIDAAGCKGLRIGGAVVSEKHANFFVADPGAHADDVHALVIEVQRRVEEATGVRLVPELRFVGYTHEEVGR